MSLALFYNGQDSQAIQDCYQAARTILSNNDRFNIDGVWSAGLSTWNSPTNRVYSAGPPEVWVPACRNPDGTPNTGLCDKDTHLIVINGTWARSVAVYGAVQGQPIHKAGFVLLMKRMGAADPNVTRGAFIGVIADDIASTALEPAP